MLILLQHNAAHLGIITGKCLAEGSYLHLNPTVSKIVLSSAFMASISTAMAELLGGSIALNMIFDIPIKLALVIILPIIIFTTLFYKYNKIEKIIISCVAIISFLFFYETTYFPIAWKEVFTSAITPSFPENSILIIVGVLGAVVMPHNLFLHSEIIQSRNFAQQDIASKKRLLKYEFLDTLVSMLIGWAINSVIIILAAEVFFKNNIQVTELSQASDLLKPILGSNAALVFAIALLLCGFASSITAGIAGGTITAGLFHKEYDEKSIYTKMGVITTLILASIIIFTVSNPLKGLIYSQVILSMQLPITIFLQLYLTSSKKVMGDFKNGITMKTTLILCGVFVTVLNVILLWQIFQDLLA
jgi:manganese transport protein